MLPVPAPTWKRCTFTAVVLLALVACGTTDRGGETAGTSSVPPVETSTTEAPVTSRETSSATSASGPAGALLKRRDAPPEGVKAQFEFFQEGDGACFGLDESKPAAVVDFPKPEIAMTFVVCFPGFAANQPVEADVRLPDGKVRRITATSFNSPDGLPFVSWTSVPGDPLGKYEVAATQGARKGTGTFTVSAASTPRMVAIEPSRGAPGTTFRFGLAGFVARSTVDLHLYRSEGNGTHSYLTTVPAVMDGQGQTILSIPTASDDPKGSYCILRRGPRAAPDYSCGSTFDLI